MGESMKPPVRKVRKIQKYLFDYLSIDLDPYDFPHHYLEEWALEAGIEIGEDDLASDLMPEQLEAYEKWLRDGNKGERWVAEDPYGSAPYLTLSEAVRMPIGTWAIHFTRGEPFEAFEKGADLFGLQLSTWRKEKEAVNCEENLNPDESPYGTRWSFAFEARRNPRGWMMDILSYGKHKYGDNAVLFQTDGAVRVWHAGDEEYQLIFPACSEYNVVQLWYPVPGEFSCRLKDGREVVFGTIEKLIAYLEEAGERGVSGRVQALDCSR